VQQALNAYYLFFYRLRRSSKRKYTLRPTQHTVVCRLLDIPFLQEAGDFGVDGPNMVPRGDRRNINAFKSRT
jgi:hypothetical protein